MAPAVTVDVTLNQSSSYRALKAETFRLTTPAQIDRHVNRAAAAAPAGAEEQQEAAVLQAASSSSSLQDAGFDQLCNDGAAWTWSNFVVKLYRNTLGLLKQLYLIFMTLSLRTNHLMVSRCRRNGVHHVSYQTCGSSMCFLAAPGSTGRSMSSG